MTVTESPSTKTKTSSGRRVGGRRQQDKTTRNDLTISENSKKKNGSGNLGVKIQQGVNTPVAYLNQSQSPVEAQVSVPRTSVEKNYKKIPVDKEEANCSAKNLKRQDGGDTFTDYECLSQRLKKTMYFANKLPSTTRPSFPLTMLAVNAFTSGSLGNTQLNTLEFLDLEMASEIGRNACVSPTALVMALVYLDRLSNQNPDYLTSVKPSELFVVALLVASKFIQNDGEDSCIYNDEWARSAKMKTREINRLELKFLDALDWKVNVCTDEFDNVLERIEANLAMDQGNSRGWFTYTEMEMMSHSVATWTLIWPTVYHYAVQVITAATLTYTAILTTLLSSTIFAPQIYMFSKAFLTTTTLIQGSDYLEIESGLHFINGNIDQCFDFNQTVHITTEDILSNLSFELDIEHIELETNEKSGNNTYLKLPYYYFQYSNQHQKYFRPQTYRHNILGLDTGNTRQQNEWKRQPPPSLKQTQMNQPTFTVFKLNALPG